MSNENFDHSMDRARTILNGASSEFLVDDCQSQIRADIVGTEFTTVRVWGQVRNCFDRPVPGVLLKLVRVERDEHGKCRYHGLAHTITDCEGFYQFDISANSTGVCYRVLANKSALGPERIICVDDPCTTVHDDCKCKEDHDDKHDCKCKEDHDDKWDCKCKEEHDDKHDCKCKEDHDDKWDCKCKEEHDDKHDCKCKEDRDDKHDCKCKEDHDDKWDCKCKKEHDDKWDCKCKEDRDDKWDCKCKRDCKHSKNA